VKGNLGERRTTSSSPISGFFNYKPVKGSLGEEENGRGGCLHPPVLSLPDSFLMRVGIVGGGITGLFIAHSLSQNRVPVTLFEKYNTLGGLIGCFKLGEVYLERYYHHLFKSDTPILQLLEQLGLQEKLIWREAKMGFFHQGKLYGFGTPLDLLRFTPLSLWERFRFGLSTLYLQRQKNWQNLEDIKVRDWITKYQGRRVYEIIWKPLLQAKFGEDYENISASWLWGRVNARGNSRSKGGHKEELGYIKGGFQQIVTALEASILRNGGRILKSTPVENIRCQGPAPFTLKTFKGSFAFDKVVFCAPIPDFLKALPQLPEDYVSRLKRIKYRAALCLILKLKEPLSDIYWLNISDPDIPFGGVIEHTNFVPPSEYRGFRIAYIFNYLDPQHPFYHMTKPQLFQTYLPALKKIFPHFKEASVEQSFLTKAYYATPVYTFQYSALKPPFETPIKDLYLANTSQIYPEDRNTSNGVAIGREVVRRLLA